MEQDDFQSKSQTRTDANIKNFINNKANNKTIDNKHCSLVENKLLVTMGEIFHRGQQITDGCLNSSIPQLGKQDPNLWAASVVLVQSGKTADFGPVQSTVFTIQSIVKVLLFGYAAKHLGVKTVSQFIKCRGVCRPFNTDFLAEGVAPNACLNNGALTASALILQRVHPGDQNSWRHALKNFTDFLQKVCGGNVKCDHETYLSEISSASGNRNILRKLQESGVISANAECENTLKLYTGCCALLVNTEQLANIGLMFAQNGKSKSGLQVLEPSVSNCCLSQMMQAGLYEESGDFFTLTGIIAKSGVSGGIVAVAHKKMAVGLFSPKLNEYGNSVRGMNFLKELALQVPSLHHLSEEPFSF